MSVKIISLVCHMILLKLYWRGCITRLSKFWVIVLQQPSLGIKKIWWTQEFGQLKQASVTSAKIWKDTGKPRAGLIFSKYKEDKLQYKRRICEERAKETSMITNDLHQALLKKSGQTFWKCWKSKFGSQWMIEMAILVVV